MKFRRLLTLFFTTVLLAAGCGKKVPPSDAPKTVRRWWCAVALGDRAAAGRCVASGAAGEAAAVHIEEYDRVKKRAAAGDELAVRMLKRLEGVRIGEVRCGPERAVVRMVMSDGKPFLTAYLELRGDRWVIAEFE